jgi:hypothetical protein
MEVKVKGVGIKTKAEAGSILGSECLHAARIFFDCGWIDESNVK